MILFYTPDIKGDEPYTLNEEESRHCIRVLRLGHSDIIHLTDGRGNIFKTRIIHPDLKKCEVEIIEINKEFEKRNNHLHIAIAPTKNINRFEWFLEKATEIGIDEITPVICDHSERKVIKHDRLNKVIIAALKQSLKAYLPRLNQATTFKEFIRAEYTSEKYIAHLDKDNKQLKEVYSPGADALIFIGPEGDFSNNEIKEAIQRDFTPINLGFSRLRTETAGIVACQTINLLNY